MHSPPNLGSTMTDSAQPSDQRAPSRRSGELVGIQYLRGIAAIMVVVFHLKSSFERMGYAGPPAGLSSGVDIFFVISGFIMVLTTAGKNTSPLTFWWRRLTRIAPLYWLVTAFMVSVTLIAPNAVQSSAYETWHVLASFLFIPASHPVLHGFSPVIIQGWTLNYEIFFYFIFGISLLLPNRFQIPSTLVIISLLVLSALIFPPPASSIRSFYASSIILEFGMGMILALLARPKGLLSKLPSGLGLSLVALGFVVLALTEGDSIWRAVERGLPSMAIVAGVLILESKKPFSESRILHALGNASYSIYIIQGILTSALAQAWRHANLDGGIGSLLAFSIIDVALCAGGGFLCYAWIERPLTQLAHKGGARRARLRSATA